MKELHEKAIEIIEAIEYYEKSIAETKKRIDFWNYKINVGGWGSVAENLRKRSIHDLDIFQRSQNRFIERYKKVKNEIESAEFNVGGEVPA